MTLDQIVSVVTSKVGQTDSVSVGLCEDYAQRRFQMIYDAHPWNGSRMNGSATATAGNASVTLPAGMDRVIAIRANGRFLDPVNSEFLLQTDPTIFERSGLPTVYEEWTDTASSNAKKIKLFPVPAVNTALLIVGKRVLTNLSAGSDVPVLRNIDNCLIAFTQYDMLQRQRQYAKAGEVLKEAGAMLEAAWALEQEQANKPRLAKQLTIAGNSLAELTDAVCARAKDWSLEGSIFARDCLRRNYQAIYDRNLWAESTVIVSVASDGLQIVLPEYVGRVISVRADAGLGQLVPVDTSLLFGIAPQIFEQTTGAQVAFAMLAPVGVSVLPPGLEKLKLVSTNTNDKVLVSIWGESAGYEVREVVTLNGLTEVETANFYDTPLSISKEATTGTVVVTGSTSTVELQRLQPTESERKHMRLWLQPSNTAGTTCLVLGKRRIRPFVNDQDTPLLRDIQMPLIEMSVADMLSRAGNATGAAEARAKAEASIKTMIDLENNQGASGQRVIPSVEPMYGMYGCEDWIVAK